MEREMCRTDSEDYALEPYTCKHSVRRCSADIFRINKAKLNLSIKLSEGLFDVRSGRFQLCMCMSSGLTASQRVHCNNINSCKSCSNPTNHTRHVGPI